jgi:hypothetical protein
LVRRRKKMSKWKIVAYANAEYGLPKKEKIIEAKEHDEAMRIAWDEFPEYDEVGAYEVN